MMRRFMVEKNSIVDKQAISLLLIDHILVCYNFQNNIKTQGWKMVVFLFIYLWPPFGFLDIIGSCFLLGLQSCVCSQRLPSFLRVYLVKKENEDCLHICCQRCSLHQTLHNVDKCNASTFWGLEQQKWFWWWWNNLHIVNVHAINHLGPKTKCELMLKIIPLLKTIITSGHQALVQFANKFTLLDISKFWLSKVVQKPSISM